MTDTLTVEGCKTCKTQVLTYLSDSSNAVFEATDDESFDDGMAISRLFNSEESLVLEYVEPIVTIITPLNTQSGLNTAFTPISYRISNHFEPNEIFPFSASEVSDRADQSTLGRRGRRSSSRLATEKKQTMRQAFIEMKFEIVLGTILVITLAVLLYIVLTRF